MKKLFLLICIFSFNSRAETLACSKMIASSGISSWYFHLSEDKQKIVEIKSNENLNLNDESIFTYVNRTETNTFYLWENDTKDSRYVFHRFDGMMIREKRNRKDEWVYDFRYGNCVFVNAINL